MAGGGEREHQRGVCLLVQRLPRAEVPEVREDAGEGAGAAGRVGVAEYRLGAPTRRLDRGRVVAEQCDVNEHVRAP